MSPPFIRMRNPVDIWPAVTRRGLEDAYCEGTDTLLADRNIDAVVVVLMLTGSGDDTEYAFLVDLARRYPHKPLFVTFTGDRERMEAARDFLEPRGVPTFPLIEQPFEVLDILCACRRSMERAPSGSASGGTPP